MRAALLAGWRAFGAQSLLLVSLVLAQFGYDAIASFYPPDAQLRAARAWHSVLRAAPETALLWVVVWIWAPRRWPLFVATSIVCLWGLIENLQIALCRLQFPMYAAPPDTELFSGLCDLATGWPVYMSTVLVVLLSALLPRKKAPPP